MPFIINFTLQLKINLKEVLNPLLNIFSVYFSLVYGIEKMTIYIYNLTTFIMYIGCVYIFIKLYRLIFGLILRFNIPAIFSNEISDYLLIFLGFLVETTCRIMSCVFIVYSLDIILYRTPNEKNNYLIYPSSLTVDWRI